MGKIKNMVVMIHGKAFSGKDTIFETARSVFSRISLDSDVVRIALANEVKHEYCRLHPEISFERLMSDPSYKEKHRAELIGIGDGYRQDDPDIWVNKHEKTLTRFLDQNQSKLIFVTDVRYKNEKAYAENYQHESALVTTMKIEAPLIHRLSRMRSLEAIEYYWKTAQFNQSEMDLDGDDDFETIIHNPNVSFHQVQMEIERKIEPILEIFRKIQKGCKDANRR